MNALQQPISFMQSALNSFGPSIMGAMNQLGSGLQANANRVNQTRQLDMQLDNTRDVEQLRQQGQNQRTGAILSLLGGLFGGGGGGGGSNGGGFAGVPVGGFTTNYGGGVSFDGGAAQRRTDWLDQYRRDNGLGGQAPAAAGAAPSPAAPSTARGLPQGAALPGVPSPPQGQGVRDYFTLPGRGGGTSSPAGGGTASAAGGMSDAQRRLAASISPYLLPEYDAAGYLRQYGGMAGSGQKHSKSPYAQQMQLQRYMQQAKQQGARF